MGCTARCERCAPARELGQRVIVGRRADGRRAPERGRATGAGALGGDAPRVPEPVPAAHARARMGARRERARCGSTGSSVTTKGWWRSCRRRGARATSSTPPPALLQTVREVFGERGYLAAHRHRDGFDRERIAAVEAWSAEYGLRWWPALGRSFTSRRARRWPTCCTAFARARRSSAPAPRCRPTPRPRSGSEAEHAAALCRSSGVGRARRRGRRTAGIFADRAQVPVSVHARAGRERRRKAAAR